MRETCAGMLAAAEQGIIHRDLKPSNLLIGADGCARVSDFGLARAPAGVTYLTGSGQLLGTPHYMAPDRQRPGRAGRPPAGGRGPLCPVPRYAELWPTRTLILGRRPTPTPHNPVTVGRGSRADHRPAAGV